MILEAADDQTGLSPASKAVASACLAGEREGVTCWAGLLLRPSPRQAVAVPRHAPQLRPRAQPSILNFVLLSYTCAASEVSQCAIVADDRLKERAAII